MMLEAIIILIFAALPLMGSPGPATLSIAAAGSAYGVRPSLSYMVGVITGTATVLILIATGITGIVTAIPGIAPVITSVAVLYILYLAFRIATAPVGSIKSRDRSAPAFIGGYLLAISNPKAFAAIGAVFTGVTILPDDTVSDATAKVVVLSGVIIVVHFVRLFIGAGLARLMSDPRKGRAINILLLSCSLFPLQLR